MKQPEQSYTAIETAHGFVFFTDTTEGQKNRQDFLQFMADHYFDPHFNLGPVNVYRAEGVLKDGSYVNPGEGLYPNMLTCRWIRHRKWSWSTGMR